MLSTCGQLFSVYLVAQRSAFSAMQCHPPGMISFDVSAVASAAGQPAFIFCGPPDTLISLILAYYWMNIWSETPIAMKLCLLRKYAS